MSQTTIKKVSAAQLQQMLQSNQIKFLRTVQQPDNAVQCVTINKENPTVMPVQGITATVSSASIQHSIVNPGCVLKVSNCQGEPSPQEFRGHEGTVQRVIPVPKENFIWSKQATLSMLDCYEMRFGSAGYSKADKKLWQCIADDLNALDKKFFPDPVTWSQVKDKFNNTKVQANKKKDHNSRSGNDPREYTECETRVLEIIGSRRQGGDVDVAVGTPIFPNSSCKTPQPFNGSQQLQCQMDIEDDDVSSLFTPSSPKTPQNQDTPRQKPVSSRFSYQQKKKHGTHSNQAKTKLQLELQWSQHLQRVATLDELKHEALQKQLEVAHRTAAAKERKNELFSKYLQLKELSMRRRDERFRKLLELQQQKVDVERRKVELEEARACKD